MCVIKIVYQLFPERCPGGSIPNGNQILSFLKYRFLYQSLNYLLDLIIVAISHLSSLQQRLSFVIQKITIIRQFDRHYRHQLFYSSFIVSVSMFQHVLKTNNGTDVNPVENFCVMMILHSFVSIVSSIFALLKAATVNQDIFLIKL